MLQFLQYSYEYGGWSSFKNSSKWTSAAFRTATIKTLTHRWSLPKCSFQKQLSAEYLQITEEKKGGRLLFQWHCKKFTEQLFFKTRYACLSSVWSKCYLHLSTRVRIKLSGGRDVQNWHSLPFVKLTVRS